MLDGDEVNLKALALDGRACPARRIRGLVARARPSPSRRGGRSRSRIETEIDPTANTKLMGLYRSGGNYCTQCEAEGFRRITYFLDRPDVLAVYTTRIEADRDEAPVLLGNGNPVEAGAIAGTNRHYRRLARSAPEARLSLRPRRRRSRPGCRRLHDRGRAARSSSRIYVEPGKEDRAGYAHGRARSARCAGTRSAFGREYDLDVFNIVAVSDFNMGAMENKGLNIFNDKYVLASPETATDADYAHIEAIIAHEYFHNWTGNRITCRDWFQLCLKEGLTVFRDQEFSSDERSRAGQAHRRRAHAAGRGSSPRMRAPSPIRCARPQYREINNFYTATVYEKGAEIVRMLKTMIGDERFRRGMDLYFKRCDGTAATVEDFLAAFADVSGRDLSHFARGTRRPARPGDRQGHYDRARRRPIALDFAQATPPTPGQDEKEPMAIPVRLGLVAPDGTRCCRRRCERLGPTGRLRAGAERDSITFANVAQRPLPSLFRDFSAPVKVCTRSVERRTAACCCEHDSDPFNRWQAAQTRRACVFCVRLSRRRAR